MLEEARKAKPGDKRCETCISYNCPKCDSLDTKSVYVQSDWTCRYHRDKEEFFKIFTQKGVFACDYLAQLKGIKYSDFKRNYLNAPPRFERVILPEDMRSEKLRFEREFFREPIKVKVPDQVFLLRDTEV